MSPLLSDPGRCPSHQATVEHLNRLDARVDDLESEGDTRERRLTILETEISSRSKSIAAVLPIILALLSAAVAIWSALHRSHP